MFRGNCRPSSLDKFSVFHGRLPIVHNLVVALEELYQFFSVTKLLDLHTDELPAFPDV